MARPNPMQPGVVDCRIVEMHCYLIQHDPPLSLVNRLYGSTDHDQGREQEENKEHCNTNNSLRRHLIQQVENQKPNIQIFSGLSKTDLMVKKQIIVALATVFIISAVVCIGVSFSSLHSTELGLNYNTITQYLDPQPYSAVHFRKTKHFVGHQNDKHLHLGPPFPGDRAQVHQIPKHLMRMIC